MSPRQLTNLLGARLGLSKSHIGFGNPFLGTQREDQVGPINQTSPLSPHGDRRLFGEQQAAAFEVHYSCRTLILGVRFFSVPRDISG